MSTISDALKKKRGEEHEPSKETAAPRIVEVQVPKDHTVRTTLLATVLGVLVLTGAVVGGYALLGRMGAFDPRPTAPQPPAAPNHPPEAQTEKPNDVENDDEAGPAAEHTQAPALPKLEGIVNDPVEPRAFINGRILKLGRSVDGYTLVAIEEDRVVLEREGRRYELVLE